jgi:excisionase family DNA binding protein
MSDSPWMSPEEVAAHFGIPVGTLYAWRYKGVGPKGAKIGRHVRYRRTDVDAWADAQSDPRTAA